MPGDESRPGAAAAEHGHSTLGEGNASAFARDFSGLKYHSTRRTFLDKGDRAPFSRMRSKASREKVRRDDVIIGKVRRAAAIAYHQRIGALKKSSAHNLADSG